MTAYRPVPDPVQFKVAFSFAGEERGLVREIAEALAGRYGRELIFLDEWHREYIAGPEGDLRLANVYATAADLVVPCVSQAYADKVWTRLEHRRIRGRIMQASLSVLPLRVGAGDVPGLTDINEIVPDVRDIGVQEAVDLIETRLRRLRTSGAVETDDRVIKTRQRAAELAYLNTFLQNPLFRDRWERWVAVEGVQRTAASLSRAMSVSIRVQAFRKTSSDEDTAMEAPVSRTYRDVLDAYREVAQRNRARRLAVLGEPGAGKSFSLERIGLEYAKAALDDPAAPIPFLLSLNLWTDAKQTLVAFIDEQLAASPLGAADICFDTLRQARRAVLLLDGLNEVPPGQRKTKAAEIQTLSEDACLVSVLVSCREKDFVSDFQLPFDTLTLQPLTPRQVRDCLRQMLALHYGETPSGESNSVADAFFWRLAGNAQLAAVWRKWEDAGADFDLFWTAAEVPRQGPNVFSTTSRDEDDRWRQARFEPRSLLRLAANPFLLTVMVDLHLGDALPINRAELFERFVNGLYDNEREARNKRGDADSVPDRLAWQAALVTLAEALQRMPGSSEDEGAQTTLARTDWPAIVTPAIVDFSRDASVVQLVAGKLRFSHQLLQEYLASRALLEASSAPDKVDDFWPATTWWQRTGWEIVAELAAESLGNDAAGQTALIEWVARANPEIACSIWRQLGEPLMPDALHAMLREDWLLRMTDVAREPAPAARAAIGRALGRFGLDNRPGIGLSADGLPDIAWIRIPSAPFVYQDARHAALPDFEIARYPITHTQFDAFIHAGGYRDARWWSGLARRFEEPAEAQWTEPNAPRETVSWYEAVAFCRWLGYVLDREVMLPTEQQWERAARGTEGSEYPWGEGYRPGFANINEFFQDAGPEYLGRTTAPGLYPHGASADHVEDLAGNVWEWCLNEYSQPDRSELSGSLTRALRGSSWFDDAGNARSAARDSVVPVDRDSNVGFRVVCSSP